MQKERAQLYETIQDARITKDSSLEIEGLLERKKQEENGRLLFFMLQEPGGRQGCHHGLQLDSHPTLPSEYDDMHGSRACSQAALSSVF